MLNRCLDLQLPQGQSLFLWGARKTGKSTFLAHKYPNSMYVDFLHNAQFLEYSKKPGLLRTRIEAIGLSKITSPVIIDEVQKVPEILDEIHWMIEHFKGIAFIMCGSSMRKLKAIGSNLLGGRAWRQIFLPLCYPELPEFDLLKIFNHGLIPSHFLSQTYPKRLLEGYLADYVIPEVQWEGRVRNLGNFSRFLEAIAFSNSQILNYSNIARECFVSLKTVQGYIELLLDMMLGYLILPYTKRSSRQVIVSQPKFYFFDTAIANVLLKRKIEMLKGSEAGCSLEHYVFLELVAYKQLKDISYEIKYWRTKTGLEVDFIIESKQLFAIEVKISSHVDKTDLNGLIAFTKDAAPTKSIVVCLESHRRILKVDEVIIEIWPIEEFLKELWKGGIVV